MNSGWRAEAVERLAHAARLGVLHRDYAIPVTPRHRGHDAVDGREENEIFRFYQIHLQRHLVGEGALRAECDEFHRFTMLSIKVSVISCPFRQ